jgi:hypothetical protein
MARAEHSMEEDIMLEKIKEILLREDRDELQRLHALIDDPTQLSGKVLPILESRMSLMKKTFPQEFEVIINSMVDKKMKNSQNELLDILHPIMGKMITRYIQMQLELLKESIDERIQATFGTQNWLVRAKNNFLGIKQSEVLLSNMNVPIIQEVYIIQHYSGILIGSASREKVIDTDMIAGMLTAIKSFVEDAFQRDREALELIEYGTYKIIIQNFHTYYLATAVSGTLTIHDRNEIATQLLNFGEIHLKKFTSTTADYYIHCSRLLHEHFIQTQDRKR